MSKNIENDDSNEIQPKSRRGYSFRRRNSSKKDKTYSKFSSEQENESQESNLLKKKRKHTEYSSSSLDTWTILNGIFCHLRISSSSGILFLFLSFIFNTVFTSSYYIPNFFIRHF